MRLFLCFAHKVWEKKAGWIPLLLMKRKPLNYPTGSVLNFCKVLVFFYLSALWKFNVSRIKQQNLLANDAFQNKLERCTVEALERPVKPGDEQEVMNSSDDTCSFSFLLCNELRNWAWNWKHFCKYKAPSVISLPSAVHVAVCVWMKGQTEQGELPF